MQLRHAYRKASVKPHNLFKLPYPFQFTLNPSKFQFQDPRFYQQPVENKLHSKELQHIQYVLTNHTELLRTGQTTPKISQYIHPQLLHKTLLFRSLLKSQEASMEFQINFPSIDRSKGYLEYYGVSTQSKCIQDYNVQRKNERVVLNTKQRQKKEEKSAQQQLKEDMKALEASMNPDKAKARKEIKEKVAGTKSKYQIYYQQVVDFLNSFKTQANKKTFEDYIVVDRVEGQMTIKLETESYQVCHEKARLQTRWLYPVKQLETEEIIKSRKRILYDFQLWNRGMFIPNYQYV